MVIKRIFQGFAGVIITLSALISQAQADELRVYPGEYVVTGHKESRSRLVASKGFIVEKRIGKAKLLRKGSSSRALSLRKSIAYDIANDDCQNLLKTGEVQSCSPNFEIKISATSNDSKITQLWGFNSSKGSDVFGAWDITKGSENVVVAVIDTGIDYNHPDLKDNIWVNPFEIPANGLDDDGNGYIDDIHGISAINGSGNPMDDNNHGTHVSGTIGAKGNNSQGVAGINWNTRLMGLKFLDASGSGSLADAIECINYMVDMKNRGVNIRVSNNSWGGGGFSQGLFEAITAAKDAGIIFVAAAGNSSNDNDSNSSYPASYEVDNVVSVAAIDSNQNLASFSNYGLYSVDIAAPGVGILSTTKNNQYASYSGTSMASPHVAGALALLFSVAPELDYQAAIARLYNSGTDSDTLTGITYTSRKLNVSRLIRNQVASFPIPEGNSTNCEYSINEVAYAPDLSADSAEVVLQGDEYVFKTIDLPFNFPFYDESISRITLSPNGLIYFKGEPSSLDFKNSEKAPFNSFAALHTDLYLVNNPHGIRVSSASDHVTIYWLAKQYKARSKGDVEVRTTIYSDGSITNYVSVKDAEVEALLQSSATIGINAKSIATDYTYAYNSSLIHNENAVKFTRNCKAAPGEEQQGNSKMFDLEGYTYNGNGDAVKRIYAQRLVNLDFFGTGNGTYEMNLKLDKFVCPQKVSVDLRNGSGYSVGLVPKGIRKYRNVTFSIGSINDTLGVKISQFNRSKKNRIKKALKVKDCKILARNLNQ